MDFDDAVDEIGPFGPFQRRVLILTCVSQLMIAIHTLSPVYVAYVSDHWCQTPHVQPNTTCTKHQLRAMTVPYTYDAADGGTVAYDSCTRYDRDYQTLTSEDPCYEDDVLRGHTNHSYPVVDCEAWHYDRSIMLHTIVTDFDIVCEQSHWQSSVGGIFLLSQSIAFFVFGPVTDWFGRKKTFLLGNLLTLAASLGTAFSSTFTVFLALRIALAIAASAEGCASIILIMEYVGRRYRVFVGICMGCMWVSSTYIVSGLAYILKDWRHMHIVLAIPNVFIILGTLLFIPESPRWLIVKNRQDAASKIMSAVAKRNGRHWDGGKNIIIKETKHESILRALRKPSILYVSLVQYLSWFASGICYYAVVFSTPSIGDNPFVSFMITGASEFPGMMFILATFTFIGRVPALSFGNSVGGLLLLATIFALDNYWLNITLVMLAKAFIGGCYTGIWIYSNEMYPTSVRSSAASITYIFTRVGSTLGAYVFLLASVYEHLPIIVCGSLALLAGLLNTTLPETRGSHMTQTVKEGHVFVRRNVCGLYCCRKTPSKYDYTETDENEAIEGKTTSM